MNFRRVVTGHSPQGKSIFTHDEVLEPITFAAQPGAGFFRIWGGDEAPVYPDDGSRPSEKAFFPEVGGYRMVVMIVAPNEQATSLPDVDPRKAYEEIESKLPGITKFGEPDNPGMHTTDTVDMELVLSGEITLELDDGVEKVVRAGETIIQNGTRHRWHNRSTEPAVLLAFVVGAHRKG